MVGAVPLGQLQLVVGSRQRDDRRAGTEQLGVLDGVDPEAAGAQDGNRAPRAERARLREFLDAAVRRQPGIGERRQHVGGQVATGNADDMLGRNRQVFRVTAVRTEARPAAVGADLLVAVEALRAGLVAPRPSTTRSPSARKPFGTSRCGPPSRRSRGPA
jgi:hypothetical protein